MPPIVTGIRYGGKLHGMSVLADAPVGREADKLLFRRYLDPIVSVLTDPNQETPFTVGIFGPWGSGKSSLLRMLREELADVHDASFVCVDFNAWIHRSEPNLLVPLLHTLRDALESDKRKRFTASVEKLGTVLVNLGADLLLRAVTAGSVTVENLEKLETSYLQRRSRVESEMRNLRRTLEHEVGEIHKRGASLVIVVDDLDRCGPDQIIGLLDAIKLFLDFKHVFVVLAVDREVVRRGIQVKYKDFKFSLDRDEVIGHEYLEKMVQLPVELFPLSTWQIDSYVQEMLPRDEHSDIRSLIRNVALPNARRIKRLVNIFAVVQSLMRADDRLKDMDRVTVLRLIALQVQYPELYWEAVRMPVALVALETRYDGGLKKEEEFDAYGGIKKPVKVFCDRYHRPASALASLFKGSSFKKLEKDLPLYLAMLGGPGA